MKRSYRKNIVRSMKNSIGRFLSVFAITALGVGFLAGLLSTTPDMKYTVDKYYDENRLFDIFMKSTGGFTEADVRAVRETSEIGQADGYYIMDVLGLDSSGNSHALRMQSTDFASEEAFCRLNLLEGRFPENEHECVIEFSKPSYEGIHPGDKLTLTSEDEDLGDTYAVTEFTVTGIVESPEYFSMEDEATTIGSGKINCFVYVDEKAFALDYYTEIRASVRGAEAENCFSDAYEERMDKAVDSLEILADDREVIRYQEIIDEATEKLQEKKDSYQKKKKKTQKKLADAKKKLDDGEAEIKENEQKLESGKRELESGRQDLKANREKVKRQLADGKKKLESGKKELASQQKKLESAKKQLDASAEEIEQARQAVTSGMLDEETSAALSAQIAAYDSSKKQYEEGVAAAKKAEKELKAQETKLASSEKTAQNSFEQAERKLAAAEKEIADGEKELAKARKKLADSREKYKKNKKKAEDGFAKAEKKIADAEAEIEDIDEVTWYVLDRNSNVGYVSFYGNADKVAAIAKVFPVFFFLIAALVVLTTMTRMVEEERTEIGVIKALGYSDAAVAWKYLIYAGIAALLGCAAGLAAGLRLFPSVIWNAYSIMYTEVELICLADPVICVGAAGLLVLSVLGATLYASMGVLREKPAALMIPKAPKAGKRVFLEYIRPLWNHMKFTYKVTARNLLRYKKRFFMTILGVAGCTALLLTGFGLRDSIGDIVGIQYRDLQKYDLEIRTEKEVDLTEDSVLTEYLENSSEHDGYLQIHRSGAEISVGKEKGDLTLMVPKDAGSFEEFRNLRDRRTKEKIGFDGSSVVLTEKIAERLEVTAGDTVTVENADSKRAEFTVTGIAENYLYSYVFVGVDAYREAYGEEPEYLCVNVKSHAKTPEAEDTLSRRLLEDEAITGIQFSTDTSTSFEDMLSKIDYIVIVLIICAGLLAFIVLYDLTNINISERQKEIATIKVLGFYDNEVSAYIYRETVVLSILGTLTGLVLGIFLHAFVIQTAEMDSFMFGRQIYSKSFVLAAVITMLFSAAVNVVMGRKMRHIDMAESMKAVD